jgi:50S ribosomal subunit-associated GTPase HflX
MFLRGAEVAVIVFDLSNPPSFAHLSEWLKLLNEFPIGQCQTLVVGNKKDLQPWVVRRDEIERFSITSGYSVLFTSAANNDGIVNLFKEIAGIIATKRTQVSEPSSKVVFSEPAVARMEAGSGCC